MDANGRISDPVVAQVINQLIRDRNKDCERVNKLKEKVDQFEKDYIHNNYKMKEMIVEAVKEGMKPLLADSIILSKRLTIVEDMPKTWSHTFVMWAFAASGSIIVALVIALIRLRTNI